ncbi:HU family DNA-binding protein [Tolypothrix sp. FACHB-123]|nr:HU family DNA-binding protein [Tolypothrix sp. FACHB-123]
MFDILALLQCLLPQIKVTTMRQMSQIIMAILAMSDRVRRECSEREWRNPKTKEKITIPATTVPAFSALKQFRSKVSSSAP